MIQEELQQARVLRATLQSKPQSPVTCALKAERLEAATGPVLEDLSIIPAVQTFTEITYKQVRALGTFVQIQIMHCGLVVLCQPHCCGAPINFLLLIFSGTELLNCCDTEWCRTA